MKKAPPSTLGGPKRIESLRSTSSFLEYKGKKQENHRQNPKGVKKEPERERDHGEEDKDKG